MVEVYSLAAAAAEGAMANCKRVVAQGVEDGTGPTAEIREGLRHQRSHVVSMGTGYNDRVKDSATKGAAAAWAAAQEARSEAVTADEGARYAFTVLQSTLWREELAILTSRAVQRRADWLRQVHSPDRFTR